MAHRRATLSLNQENVNSRLTAKSNLVQPVATEKRAALGEVGNRLQAVQKTNSTILKQNGHMGPPENMSKKVGNALPSKKDTAKSTTEKDAVAGQKNTIKRQESILKPISGNVTACKDTTRKVSNETLKPSIINPDENSKNDPQMVPEYLMDIFKYLREMEMKLSIKKNFLESHESNSRMRSILVNWLVDVHTNFKFTLETLHICIGIVDRYLQENKKVGRSTLQLVGTSAMLIACKYEEVCLPELEDFEYVCDNTFSKRQILQMEREILKRLDFSLGRPISIQFLRRYTKIAQSRLDHHNLGKYILELVLLEDELSHVRPSLQAAAACCLSTGILSENLDLQKVWTPTLIHYTSYNYYDIKSLIAEFAYLIVKSERSKYQAIRKKYAAAKYAKISLNPKLNGLLVRKLTAGKKAIA